MANWAWSGTTKATIPMTAPVVNVTVCHATTFHTLDIHVRILTTNSGSTIQSNFSFMRDMNVSHFKAMSSIILLGIMEISVVIFLYPAALVFLSLLMGVDSSVSSSPFVAYRGDNDPSRRGCDCTNNNGLARDGFLICMSELVE